MEHLLVAAIVADGEHEINLLRGAPRNLSQVLPGILPQENLHHRARSRPGADLHVSVAREDVHRVVHQHGLEVFHELLRLPRAEIGVGVATGHTTDVPLSLMKEPSVESVYCSRMGMTVHATS